MRNFDYPIKTLNSSPLMEKANKAWQKNEIHCAISVYEKKAREYLKNKSLIEKSYFDIIILH